MKTVIEMAREAGAHEDFAFEGEYFDMSITSLERFAELVRADERKKCAKIFELYWNDAGLQRTYSPTKYINTVKEWNDYKEKTHDIQVSSSYRL
jgi:hypothetical protein